MFDLLFVILGICVKLVVILLFGALNIYTIIVDHNKTKSLKGSIRSNTCRTYSASTVSMSTIHPTVNHSIDDDECYINNKGAKDDYSYYDEEDDWIRYDDEEKSFFDEERLENLDPEDLEEYIDELGYDNEYYFFD